MASISGQRCELEARVTDHHWCVKWQWCCGGVLQQTLSDNVWSSDLRTALPASQALLCRSHLALVRIHTITLTPNEEDRVNQSISRVTGRSLSRTYDCQLYLNQKELLHQKKKFTSSVKGQCEYSMSVKALALQVHLHCCFFVY